MQQQFQVFENIRIGGWKKTGFGFGKTRIGKTTAGKEAEMSELQSHYCMLPKQWTWLLCSVSVISANKLSLQELTELIRIKLLILRFPEIFAS